MPAAGSDEFCWLCPCNKTTNPFNNFSGDFPGHWKHLRRHYVPNHPLYQIWGVSPDTLALDWMHTMDIGVSGHSIANLFYEVVFEELAGPRPQRVERLWRRIQEIYSEDGVSHKLGSFKMG
eukprot:6058463-Pyramimonas_sp.AAC.1